MFAFATSWLGGRVLFVGKYNFYLPYSTREPVYYLSVNIGKKGEEQNKSEKGEWRPICGASGREVIGENWPETSGGFRGCATGAPPPPKQKKKKKKKKTGGPPPPKIFIDCVLFYPILYQKA